MKEEKYFKNLTDRERAIFEGGISMGALFHQFVGTPVNVESAKSLEKAIKKSILLQPAVVNVDIKINEDLIRKATGSMEYTSLTGDMLEVKLTTKINDEHIVTCISYDEKLQYPIMYILD